MLYSLHGCYIAFNPIQELIQNVNLIPKEKKRIGVV